MRIRMVTVAMRRSFNAGYIGDLKELEHLLDEGYEIVASTAFGDDHIIFTLVRR